MKAGYFAKMVSFLARTLELSPTVSDCGSTHYVHYQVTGKKMLEKLDGKYYKLTEDPDEDLKLLNARKDSHLVGKTLCVRSIATCACKPMVKFWGPEKGKTVDVFCHKCFGITSTLNTDIPTGISVYESEEWTKKVEQDILSIKHLLNTISENVEFNKEFSKFFSLTGQEITADVNDNPLVPNIDDYAIYIDPETITKVEELDDDSIYNTMIYNGKFYIRNIKNASEPDILIATAGEKEIYITDYAIEMLQKNKNLIKFKDIDDERTVLFEIIIGNSELTKPLYDLMDVINKKKEEGTYTIDSELNHMVNLFIQSNISAHASAAEIIINRLIRDMDNIYERPDFSRHKLAPYSIITLTKAIEKNRSPIIGISTQYVKRQLMSDDLFTVRNGTSYLDDCYLISVPTERISTYDRLIHKYPTVDEIIEKSETEKTQDREVI